MSRLTRFLLLAIAAVVVLVVAAGVLLPSFLNTASFRTRIEAALTKSLGRQVTIAKLDLSLFSGGLVATNAVIADDPRFSTQPFLQADTVKIHVEVVPLLLHREIHVVGLSLQSPRVQLLRAADGTWNYSSIGSSTQKSSPEAQQTFPDLTVGRLEVLNGRITVATQTTPGTASADPARTYEQVNLDVQHFGLTQPFPFTASAHLPAEGTVELRGNAGPLNQQDASLTPFSGHLELKHIDPLAAGFVDSSSGVTGLIGSLTLDASWSGQQLHVTQLVLDNPHLTLLHSAAPTPKDPAANPEGSSMLRSLSVDSADIKDGSLTLSTPGQAGPPAVYQQLNAHLTNLTPTSVSPFAASAQLPGGGSLSASGKAGPFNQQNSADTPVDADVTLKHVELETSGVLPQDTGIAGTTDLQAHVQSNGQVLSAAGNATVAGIRLARNGVPSPKPLQAQFALTQNEQSRTGTVERTTLSVGGATIALAGTYQTSGPTTALNLKATGNAVPINSIEAFLPAAGIHLPQGSRLQGGTVTTSLTISGSTANPIVAGPVRLENTQLAGFDLGSKLQALSRFTGGRIGSATGSGTNIRSLSMNLREAGGAVRTDNVSLDVAGVGTATGAGSVSAAGALDYNMLLKLTGLMNTSASAPAANTPSPAGILGSIAGMIPGSAGNSIKGLGSLNGVLRAGIPVQIGGTTSNPTFTPNVGRLATGIGVNAAQGLLNGRSPGGKKTPAQNPADNLKRALGGFLNH